MLRPDGDEVNTGKGKFHNNKINNLLSLPNIIRVIKVDEMGEA